MDWCGQLGNLSAPTCCTTCAVGKRAKFNGFFEDDEGLALEDGGRALRQWRLEPPWAKNMSEKRGAVDAKIRNLKQVSLVASDNCCGRGRTLVFREGAAIRFVGLAFLPS
jgi:hypothetical protein